MYHEKISIPIKIETFQTILNYLISVKVITRKFIHNIIFLLEHIERAPYERDENQRFIIECLEFVAKLRFEGINNLNYVKNSLNQSNLNSEKIEELYEKLKEETADMTKEEYSNLEVMFSNYVYYIDLYKARPKIVEEYSKLMGFGDGPSIDAILKLRDTLESTLSAIRIADSTRDDEGDTSIDSRHKSECKSRIVKLYEEITDPSNIFPTGFKELNRFLRGGFIRGKMYAFFGPTNSAKSVVLLYMALSILLFNRGIKPKFPNKKLAVLLLTMENSVSETLDRIHAIYTGGQYDPRHLSWEVYEKQWQEIFNVLFGTDFVLVLKYRSPGQTPMQIQSLVQEIEEDNNLEVAAVVIDHLGNVGKTNRSEDDRTGLIHSTYELSDWAKRSNRLVVTAMHTNSQFDQELAEAVSNGKTNLVSMMGRHCIADSKYIERALDMAFYIYKEYSVFDGLTYLGVKYEKTRGREQDSGSNMFYHRLENGIVLRFDENTPSFFSFPRIPGSESLAGQQIIRGQAVGPALNPMSFNTDPFSNVANPGMMGAMAMMRPQAEIQLNNQVPFNIDTAGNSVLPNNTIENITEDFLDDDFNDDYNEILYLDEEGRPIVDEQLPEDEAIDVSWKNESVWDYLNYGATAV